jgi:predicted RNase H-like nuclease (RuvC/YqgF family)
MADEFQELQRQNSRLCDTVAEMKKEIKELKGEVEEFFCIF